MKEVTPFRSSGNASSACYKMRHLKRKGERQLCQEDRPPATHKMKFCDEGRNGSSFERSGIVIRFCAGLKIYCRVGIAHMDRRLEQKEKEKEIIRSETIILQIKLIYFRARGEFVFQSTHNMF